MMEQDTDPHSINHSCDEPEIYKSTGSLDSRVLSNESHKIRVEVIQPKRKIIIEPMLMMHHLFLAPLSQVDQLFVYGKMEDIVLDRMHLNHSIMSADHSTNHSGNPCLKEVNKSSIYYIVTQAAQTENAHYSMISHIVATVPALIVMVLLGSYSDKGGRKLIIVPYIVAGFISVCVFFIVLYFDLSVWILQVNNVISSITGGGSLMMVGCYAYIADTTTKDERLFRFTLLTILDEMMSIVGPIGIGYWIMKQGYIWPIVFSMVGQFINVIYVVFFVPETIKKDENRKLFTLSHIKRSGRVFLNNDNNRRWKLFTLLFVFIIYCIGSGASTPLSLFELNAPLCWNSVTIGYYKTTYTAVVAFGGLAVTKGLKWIASDETISIIASLAHSVQYIYRGFIKNTLMMFLSSGFSMFTIALMPTTRALMSQHVTPHEQGSIFGMIAVVETLALLAGTELFAYMYAKTLYISTSFVFFIAAGIYSFVVAIYIYYTYRIKKEQSQYQLLHNES